MFVKIKLTPLSHKPSLYITPRLRLDHIKQNSMSNLIKLLSSGNHSEATPYTVDCNSLTCHSNLIVHLSFSFAITINHNYINIMNYRLLMSSGLCCFSHQCPEKYNESWQYLRIFSSIDEQSVCQS